MLRRHLVTSLLLVSVVSEVAASQPWPDTTVASPRSWYAVLQGAYEVGGEPGLVLLSPGLDEEPRLRAGRGITGALGIEYRPPSIRGAAFRATIGRKYHLDLAGEGFLVMKRTVLTLQAAQLTAGGARSSFGLVTHFSPVIEESGETLREFRTAVGPMVEFGGNVFAVRVSALKYQDLDGERITAFSVGLSISGLFCDVFERRDIPDYQRCTK